MAFADPIRISRRIKFVLNAVRTWTGSIEKAVYNDDAMEAARIESGFEVLRAISANPQNGHHGSLCVMVTMTNGQFLPAHDGEMGVPQIVPFSGAQAVDGQPTKAGRVDSWRADPAGAGAVYSGAADGTPVAHNLADSDGRPSPVAGFYEVVNGRFKFTGHTAQIPVIQLTRAMADTGIPEVYEDTVIKLAIPKLVKVGDALEQIAGLYLNAGMADLAAIRNGELFVPPVPDVAAAQKAGVA